MEKVKSYYRDIGITLGSPRVSTKNVELCSYNLVINVSNNVKITYDHCSAGGHGQNLDISISIVPEKLTYSDTVHVSLGI